MIAPRLLITKTKSTGIFNPVFGDASLYICANTTQGFVVYISPVEVGKYGKMNN
jgi:hypothetical protein